MGWSKNGRWWPIWVSDVEGPRNSQHLFDPYSFTHICHGFLFFAILVSIPDAYLDCTQQKDLPWWWICLGGAGVATVLEIIWEIIENSDYVLERFRSASGTGKLGKYGTTTCKRSI